MDQAENLATRHSKTQGDFPMTEEMRQRLHLFENISSEYPGICHL